MARKSRKTIDNISKSESIQVTEKVYKTAIYVRLSVEDERKIECESVENQIKLLRDYVKSHDDLAEYDLYVDRGITGTKFDRPEFNRMVADMRAGKFNCIVVKDLSRLGRNYLETGNYLESIFPIFGIRFISVTDHYDSLTAKASEDGLIVPLKNLINEAYAKDISKKVSSSVLARQKQGKHLAGKPPYGYNKDPEDKYHLVIDDNVAGNVVRIFEERLLGNSFEKIAAGLNNDGISSPGKYHYERGFYHNERYKDGLWDYGAVRKILLNRCYVGDMVQGRTRKAFYKGQPTTIVPEEEYVVVEGTHEPIVSREIFDRVQGMFAETKSAALEIKASQEMIEMPENLFDDLFVCGDCGRKMHYKTSKREGRRNYYYVCAASAAYGDKCKAKDISKKKLDAAVETALRRQVEVYEGWMEQSRTINKTAESKSHRSELNREIKRLEEEIKGLSAKSIRLYDDFSDGVISEDDYLFAKKSYQDEIGELERTLASKKEAVNHYGASYGGRDEMADAYRNSSGFEELSKDIVRALIDKIIFFGKGRMEICFKYEDEMQEFIDDVKARCGDGK